MYLPQSKRAQLRELASADPSKAVEEIRPILHELYKEGFSKLTDVEKEQWGGFLFLHVQLLQQTIKTQDGLNEALYTLEKLKELCNRKKHPFYWAVANRKIGILYLSFRFNDVEQQRSAIIQAFENVLSALDQNKYFSYWVDARISLAKAHLLPGVNCNELKAYQLLEAALSPFYPGGNEQRAIEYLPDGIDKTEIEQAKKVMDDLKETVFEPAVALTNRMNSANDHLGRGAYREASVDYTRTKRIAQILEGERGPTYCAVLDNLEEVNFAAGIKSRAEATLLDPGSLDEEERPRDLGPFFTEDDEKIYTDKIAYFVDLFISAGNYHSAADLLARSDRLIWHRQQYPALIYAHQIKLGSLYLECDRFASSLRSYLKAVSIYEQGATATHEPIAPVYNAIATILIDHLNFSLPAKHYLEKSLQPQSVSAPSRTYEEALMQLKFARFYFENRDPEKAKQYWNLYATGIQQLGIDTALDETLLGQLFESELQYDKAEACYLQTLRRYQEPGSKETGKVLNLHLLLARLYEKYKSPGASPFDYYTRGSDLANKAGLGKKATGLKLQAGVALHMIKSGNINNINYSLQILRAVTRKESNRISEVFAIGSEEYRTKCLKEIYSHVFVLITICIHHNKKDDDLLLSVYNYILRRKGINLKIDALHKNDSNNIRKSNQFKELQRQLFNAYDDISMAVLTASSKEYLDSKVAKTKELLYAKELLVLQELHILAPSKITKFLAHENVGSVFMNLPEGSAIIEFVKYKPFQLGTMQPGAADKEKYMAVVGFCRLLTIEFVDVGECAEIDSLIRAYRNNLVEGKADFALNQGVGPGIELRKKVFDIFLNRLGGIRRIVIATDGDLSFLPFETLPADDGRYLIDDYVFSYVNSGRDVVSFKAESKGISNTPPVVMGNPKFSLDPNADLLEGAVYFKKLTETQKEIEDVAELLNVSPISREGVSKTEVLKLVNPKFLHIATHGYNVSGSNLMSNYDLFYQSMFTNGLCLSGINDYLLYQIEDAACGNGFLSAVNVLNMELTFTELVVLSACDAGLGMHLDNEGVLGLRRAFNIAGAKSMVLSLWKVPDKQTALLMKEFYQQLLSGKARVHALRNAQLTIKSRYPSPLHWGSFICLGIPSRMDTHFHDADSEKNEPPASALNTGWT